MPAACSVLRTFSVATQRVVPTAFSVAVQRVVPAAFSVAFFV